MYEPADEPRASALEPLYVVKVTGGKESSTAELLRKNGAASVCDLPSRVWWRGCAKQLLKGAHTGVVLSVACWIEQTLDEVLGSFTERLLGAVRDGDWDRSLRGHPSCLTKVPTYRVRLTRNGILAECNSTRLTLSIAKLIQEATGWLPQLTDFDLEARIEPSSSGVICGLTVPPSTFTTLSRPNGKHGEILADPNWIPKAPRIHLPDWFLAVRQENVSWFDTARFPFRKLLAGLLDVDVDALHQLHSLLPLGDSPLHPKLSKAFKVAGHHVPSSAACDNSHIRDHFDHSDSACQFRDTYRQFVKEIVTPLCGTDRVVFQSPPTLRIVLPNAPPTINLHCDQQYPKHQPGEINFWLPLTQVFGTNTLWLESHPGAGDYRPMELEYGQLLRFNGYECRHYTTHNATEHSRVSFDLRAVPAALASQKSFFGDYPAEEI